MIKFGELTQEENEAVKKHIEENKDNSTGLGDAEPDEIAPYLYVAGSKED